MGLPATTQVVFDNSPIRLVVGQVQFPILTQYGEPSFVSSFHQSIRLNFPYASRETQLAIELSTRGLQQGAGQSLWRFKSRDGAWSVVLGEASLTLEANKPQSVRGGYISISDFLNRFTTLLDIGRDRLDLSDRTRLGLRYINELRHPSIRTLGEWRRFLNPELLGFPASDLFDDRVAQSFQELRVQNENGTLVVRHGLLTGSVVEPQPAGLAAGDRFYLLDMDYFDPNSSSLDVTQTVSQMRAFNETMYRFFRWTLTPDLYQFLEPRDND